MNILNYQDYELCLSFTSEFIENLNEASISGVMDIKPIIITLNLNEGLYDVLNELVNISSPLVKSLCDNSNLTNEVEANALLTLGALMVFYLEERKLGNIDILPGYSTDDQLRDDIRNLLEELKMSGNGNGTVKKISECIAVVSNIISLVYGPEYNAGLFTVEKEPISKIVHSIYSIINKHHMNMDQFIQNFTLVNNGLSSRTGLDSLKEIFAKLGIADKLDVDDNTPSDLINDEDLDNTTIVES